MEATSNYDQQNQCSRLDRGSTNLFGTHVAVRLDELGQTFVD